MTDPESLDPDRSMWDFIALELRRQRRMRAMSGAALARLIGRDRSIVSRIESGQIPMQLDHAEIIDREWDLNRLFTRLVNFAKQRKDDEWRIGDLAEQEARATRIRMWEVGLVSGLLQTPAYARAALSVGFVRDLDHAVETRLARQATVFDRDPLPEVSVVLNWVVLEQPVGSPEIMREQFAHLLELSALSNVRIRILERSSGVHIGYDGPFKLLVVDDRDLAYIEAPHSGGLVTDPKELQSFAVRYDRIGDLAAPLGPSRELIQQAMETCQ